MSDKAFLPQHKRLPEEKIQELKSKRTHIYIRGDTGYNLRHVSARLGLTKKLTYDQVIGLLVLSFYKRGVGTLMDTPEAKAIVEG